MMIPAAFSFIQAAISAPSKDWWDKAAVLSNYLLVAIGFFGIFYAARTLAKLKEQTKAAKDAAEAALINAQALINAERARIGFSVTEMGRSFNIDAQNSGKTSARIMYAHGFTAILTPEESLPDNPVYVGAPDDNSEWIAPGEKFNLLTATDRYGFVADLSDITLCERIRDKKAILWVFGCIRYFDGVSPYKREKRFCFATSVESTEGRGIDTYMYPAGPEIYRTDT